MQSFPPGCSLPPTYRVVCRRPERHHRLLRPSGSLRGGALPPRDMRHARAIRRGVRRDAEGSGRRRRLVVETKRQAARPHPWQRTPTPPRIPRRSRGRKMPTPRHRRGSKRRRVGSASSLGSDAESERTTTAFDDPSLPAEAVSPPSTEKPASNNPSRRSKPILEPKASRQPTDRPCAHVQNQLSCSFQIRCGRSDRAIDAPADSRHSF